MKKTTMVAEERHSCSGKCGRREVIRADSKETQEKVVWSMGWPADGEVWQCVDLSCNEGFTQFALFSFKFPKYSCNKMKPQVATDR